MAVVSRIRGGLTLCIQQCLKTLCECQHGGGAPALWWVGAGDTAQCPTVHSMAPQGLSWPQMSVVLELRTLIYSDEWNVWGNFSRTEGIREDQLGKEMEKKGAVPTQWWQIVPCWVSNSSSSCFLRGDWSSGSCGRLLETSVTWRDLGFPYEGTNTPNR